MKHNIRINGEIQTLDFELGSGILDDNGQEIFEGTKSVGLLIKTTPTWCIWSSLGGKARFFWFLIQP